MLVWQKPSFLWPHLQLVMKVLVAKSLIVQLTYLSIEVNIHGSNSSIPNSHINLFDFYFKSKKIKGKSLATKLVVA